MLCVEDFLCKYNDRNNFLKEFSNYLHEKIKALPNDFSFKPIIEFS